MRIAYFSALAVLAAATMPMPASALPHMGYGVPSNSGHNGNFGRGRFHRNGSNGAAIVGDWYADGDWAMANNRSWNSDSFNDWWNDRPDRAYPRWVQEQQKNGTCTEDRMWSSGTGWRC